MPSPRMSNLLRHLLTQSEKTGKVQRADLQNGLRIAVWALPESVMLYLSRVKNFPSAGEWGIVTSNWPRTIDKAEFERKQANGRHYLVGRLLTATPQEAGHEVA